MTGIRASGGGGRTGVAAAILGVTFWAACSNEHPAATQIADPAIPSDAQRLAGVPVSSDAAHGSGALEAGWIALASAVPEGQEAVQRRLDALSKRGSRTSAQRLNVDTAKSSLGESLSQWSKARGAFGNGNLDEAVTAGRRARAQLEIAAGAVKIELPGATAPAAPR